MLEVRACATPGLNPGARSARAGDFLLRARADHYFTIRKWTRPLFERPLAGSSHGRATRSASMARRPPHGIACLAPLRTTRAPLGAPSQNLRAPSRPFAEWA